MFSSKELISFVFSNENDTYYGDDLIKRDLNHYLWERLHAGFDAVYFLSAGDGTFSIRSYGDLRCNTYTPGKKKLLSIFSGSTEQSEQGSWIQKQLRAKSGETAAFVCPLEDFCTVLSDSRWDESLEAMAEDPKRTGIFVLTASATAERTSRLLLESPVFDKLHETAVTDLRGCALRDLYGSLKKRKWDNCLFLNSFSWERIRGLLLHLVMEDADRYTACANLDSMTEYLYALFHDPQFADTQPLFHSDFPADYLMYARVYEQLQSLRSWQVLENQSAAFARQDQRPRRKDGSGVPVLRDRNSYAGRCMKIRLPGWLLRDEAAAPRASELLQSIRDQVSVPKNRLENGELAAAAEELLNQLDAVHDGDGDTFCQVLSALKFCVSHVYADPQAEETAGILEVIRKQKQAVDICGMYFAVQRDLKLYQAHPVQGSLQSVTLQQMRAKLETLEKIRIRYIDLIHSMEIALTMPASAANIQGMLEELEQEIGTLRREVPAAQELPEYADEDEDEDDIDEFDPAIYSFIPPGC